MSRIKVIPYEESTGRLKEIYDSLLSSRGKIADVHTIQSLRPESIVKHMDLYMEIMFTKSELSRAEREMMAVVVSVANQCEYCQLHHAAALNHYWKDEAKVNKLRADFEEVELSAREKILCGFANLLTVAPEVYEDDKYLKPLVDIGLSDSAILDASLVVSYFNFVNRMVLSLGLKIDDDEVKGYAY
ncbi:MAG TPA: peroxidase-related enzyme [Prolixibacteraceae bacterium]|nr:peroxidase-related enzyme [Prolixibacteraceae bacterium]